ncbi:MAG: helix-turn-helix transcriptional regulator [Lachnospiraceae bacterium]|nr:helix-turn-helix transcriptional regulator [Lachnospiraceae bacterium]
MISEQLRNQLTRRRITMEDLSSRSGVPLETIRNLMYRKARNPRLGTVVALCRALNLTIDSFLQNSACEPEFQLLEQYRLCSVNGKSLIRLIAALDSDTFVTDVDSSISLSVRISTNSGPSTQINFTNSNELCTMKKVVSNCQ